MEKVIEIVGWITLYGPDVVSAVVAVLGGVAAIALLVPGDEPEATIQKIADWLSKFSRK